MIHTSLTAQRPWRLAVWLWVAFCLASGIPGLAQAGRGTLTGTVKDSNGAVLAGASVDLKETNTGSDFAAVSGPEGLFTFAELEPGSYTLTVSAPGFASYSQSGITVEVGSTATANAVLRVGSSSTSVTVNGDASHLETESSDIGTTVSSELIADLPLEFSGAPRNPLQFVTLTPGYSGVMANSPTQLGGFKLNGGQQAGTDILVDGATIEFASANLQMNYGVSVEAVQEFKVMTNTFDSEYGRMGGGIVNLTTKSGSNALHGSVYDMLRNKDLDANSWINDYQGAVCRSQGNICGEKPIDTQNDFGAIISGPVYIPWLYKGRDKTFFMFNYEGFRFDTGGNSLNSAPTAAMLTGDFSALATPATIQGQTFPAHIIYDYTTCTGANQGQPCQPYPGNKITTPPDPVAAAMAAVLPHSSETQPYLNYEQKSTNPVDANMYEIRIDQNIGTKQKISGSYDYDWRPNTVYDAGEPLNTSATNQRTHYVRFGYDYVFSPTVLNHFNAGFSRRYRQEFSGEGGYGGNWPSKLGLKGVEDTTFPQINWNYPGNQINLPSNGADIFVDNTYQYDDTVIWQHGRNNFKFGGETRLQEFNINILTATSGEFNFASGPTSTPSDNNSGFGFASFYLGAASNADIFLPELLGWRVKYYAAFVQDDWKISPKLTANLGFRWEISTPVTEAHDQMSFLDPTLANPGAGGIPGAYVFEGSGTGRLGSNTPQTSFKNAWGPRVGLAYQVRPGTVVRAGYGIYYQSLKMGGFGENDSAGFTGSYTYPTPASPQAPAVVLSQIQSYPGPQPPFIDPTVRNGQDPTVILSKVARPGTTQTWTLDVEQQLPGKMILNVAYVGDHGDHLQAFLHDPNQGNPANQVLGYCLQANISAQATNPACAGQPNVPAPYAGFSGTVAQALRPFPQYESAQVDTVTSADPFGVYTYHALQAQLQKRISMGLTVLASYTWSKTLTNADAEYPTEAAWEANGATGALNVYNLKVEKGLSEFDTPHSVVLSYTYQLPFGKGRQFANKGGLMNAVAGGWEVAGTQTYQSGNPLAFTTSNWTSGVFAAGDANLGASPRPNLVSGANPNGVKNNNKFVFGQSSRFNPAAFTAAPNFTFGDAPRDFGNVRTFANLDENLNFSKRIPVYTDKLNTIFRMDFFNAFNRHQFTGFNTTVTSLTAAGNAGSGFGQASSTSGGRSIQAELRVSF